MNKESKSLLTLAAEAQQIANILVERGGDLTDDLEAIFTQNEIALHEKLDSYKAIEERLEAEEQFWDAKAKAAKALAQSALKARDNLKNRLKLAMEMLDVTSVSGNTVEYRLAPSPEKLETAENFDINSLPNQYLIFTPSMDRAKVKAALQDGKKIDGVFLTQGTHIRSYAKKRD